MDTKTKAPANAETLKPDYIITAPAEKVKRTVKRRFGFVIPDVLSIEICLIKRKAYIGEIAFNAESTFVYTGKNWKTLIKMEQSTLLELFQSLYERWRTV